MFLPSIAIFCVGFYFFYLQPKRKIKSFVNQARKLGYKVLELPYQFMSLSLLKHIEDDNRSLKVFKEKLKDYDLIVGNMFTKVSIVAIHPDLIKGLLSQSSKLYKHPFISDIFKLLNGGGIAFTESEEWKRKRRIISSAFHFDFINQMVPAIESEADSELKLIDEQIKNGQEIKLLPSISKILSSVVAKCFFGSEVNQYKIEGQSFCEYYIDFLNEIFYFGESLEHIIFGMTLYNLGLTSKSRKIKEKLTLIQKVAREITVNELEKVKNRKEPHKNIITTLYDNNMLSEGQNDHDPNKYTIDELIGEFFGFFAAGTDTTSNLINVTLHYLSENQFYLKKIEEQLEELKQRNLPKSEELKQMKWIDAVSTEALRINGPASDLLFRVANQDMTTGGIHISKGTTVIVMPIICNYRIDTFQNPFQFKPERWMENKNLPPYTFIPFSGGERNCIGQYLAKIQTRILLQKIIEKYAFKAKNPIKMKKQWIYSTIHSQFDLKFKNSQSK